MKLFSNQMKHSKHSSKFSSENRNFYYLIAILVILSIIKFSNNSVIKRNSLFIQLYIVPLILIAITAIGLIKNIQILYDVGIVALLPIYLICISELIQINVLSFLVNFVLFVLGGFAFYKKHDLKLKYMFVDSAIFMYVLFFPLQFTEDIIAHFSDRYVSLFYFTVIISIGIMILFVYFRSKEDSDAATEEKRVYTNFETMLMRLKEIDTGIKKINFERLGFWVFAIGVIGMAIGRVLIMGDVRQIITISTWSFVASVVLLFFNISFFSNWVVGISMPILYMMLFDLPQASLAYVIVNFIYHGMTVSMGVYIFLKRRNIKWDKILLSGLTLMIAANILNTYIQGYIPNSTHVMFITYYIIIIVAIVAFYWLRMKKKPEEFLP